MKRTFQINMPKVETFDKQLVINKATDIFHLKGYNATSMQDLVDATGLNRSSIYNSFESKHNLFLECLSAYQNKYRIKMSDILLKAANPLEAIEYLFNLYFNEATIEKDNRGCFIINCKSEMANKDKAITTFLTKNTNQMISLLEDLVLKGQQQNLVNTNKNYKDYAIYLYAAISGFRSTSIIVSNRVKLQAIIDSTLQTLK